VSTEQKTYLGDGVYAEWTGFDVVLTTENGIATTNTIMLEPDMVARLASWLETMQRPGVSR
jgi:hypothetical protein